MTKKYKDDFNLGEIVVNQGLDESFSSAKQNSPLIRENYEATELRKQQSLIFSKHSPDSNKKLKPGSGDLHLSRFQSYQADSVYKESTTAKSILSNNLSIKPIDLTSVCYSKSPMSHSKKKNQVHFAILYANPLVIKQETSNGQI